MYFLTILTVLFTTVAFADFDRTDKLADAIEENNYKKARSAVRAGADVNGKDHYNSPQSSLFLRAVKLNRVEIVELLLEYKADVNQTRGIDLYNGLMLAAKDNSKEMAELLMSYEIDVNHTTLMGRNALHVAALHDAAEVAEVLLKAPELDINKKNVAGLCALAVAARQAHKSVVLKLKDVSNAECILKAIDLAQFNAHTEIVKILGDK